MLVNLRLHCIMETRLELRLKLLSAYKYTYLAEKKEIYSEKFWESLFWFITVIKANI